MFQALKNLFSGKDGNNSAEKEVISSMESSIARMMTEAVTVETRHVDPDESVITPKEAQISYLDAEALKCAAGI